MPLTRALSAFALSAVVLTAATPASAQPSQYPPPNPPNCRNTGNFEVWLDGFRKEAVAQGISRATVAAALDGITLDPGVIARDRKQGFFAQSFLAFSDKLISQNRIKNGLARLKQHRELFAKVEKDYGVPGPVIAGAVGARERLRRQHGQAVRSCARSPRWPTTAAAARCSAPS